MFFDVAKVHAEVIALVDEDGGKEWTYSELADAVKQAGSALLQVGVVAGDRVSILSPNRAEWIIAALGIQSAGGVLVPLNTRFKGKEIGYILEKSQSKVLFCVDGFLGIDYLDLLHQTYGNASDTPIAELKDLKQVIMLGTPKSEESGKSPKSAASAKGVMGWEDFLALGTSGAQTKLDASIAAMKPEDLSDIMFTSGTTGLPKGVMLTHTQSLRGYKSWSECVGLEKGDRYLIVNPFFHAFGYKSGWLAAFMMAATIYPRAVFDVDNTLSAIDKYKITFLPGPPTIFQSILNHAELSKYDLSSLRVAVTGAAAIPVELIVSMRQELEIDDVFTGYGLTESSGIATMCSKGDSPEIIATTSGKAIPDVEIIVADEDGAEVSKGDSGEVLIKGYNITQGYLDNPQATKEAINKNGWLHTGDIGVMDENGYLRITDRKKDMFIMGGFNVYPAEIENLISSHSGVSQVAVVGIPDEKFGEVGAAFIIRKADSLELESEELLKWCKENMANYKVPRKIEFVNTLPLNASGKVLKYELRKHSK